MNKTLQERIKENWETPIDGKYSASTERRSKATIPQVPRSF